MGSTNTFKASIIIGGEIGSAFRASMRGAAKETNIVGDELKRLQRIVASTDSVLKNSGKKLSPTARKALNKQLVDLENEGVDTTKLQSEKTRYQAELQHVAKQKDKVDGLKKSVGQVGAAWASVGKTVKIATLAVGAFTAAGYGLYRFTKSVADFNSSSRVFRDFNYQLTRIRYNIGYALMPAISEALSQLSQFFAENKEEITDIAREVGNSVRQMTPFFMGLVRMGLAIGRTLAGISSIMPGWVKFGGLLAVSAVSATVFTYKAVMLGKAIYATLVPAVGLLTSAVSWLGTVMAATPVGWILAIGAAVVAVAYLIYRNWNPLKIFFRKLFTEPIQSVKELFRVIRDYKNVITQNPGKVWQAAKGGSTGVVGTARGALTIGAIMTQLPTLIMSTFFRRMTSDGSKQPNRATSRPKQTSAARQQGALQVGNLTINAAPGQSPEQIAKVVIRELDQRAQQMARLSPSTAFAFA